MNSRKHLALLLWLLVCAGGSDAQALTLVVGALSGVVIHHISRLSNSDEVCDGDGISFDEKGLKDDLGRRLYGQHIASEVIVKAVTGFMNNDNPNKPLVLSLHGTTGTGKTLASQLIVKNIYKKGMDSSIVHCFSSVVHFPHVDQVETYKSELRRWIRGNVTNCARSMFIFDEMDKMHPGLIDCMKPFMDHRQKLDGVSYQKAIFIFLSNAGGEIITRTTLDFWKAGKDREEVQLMDVERALSSPVFDYRGESNVVDFFIPFLPLERRHIVQCITKEMEARGLQPDHDEAWELADKIVNYFPQVETVFSVPGCKTIASRLRYFM